MQPAADDVCPPCGCEEGAAGHVLIWCPAVHVAWADLGGAEAPPLLQALSEAPECRAELSSLLHQASFMATSCREGEIFGWADSLRRLLRGARAGHQRQGRRDTASDSEAEEVLPQWPPVPSSERPAWMTAPPGENEPCRSWMDVRGQTTPWRGS
eukprot:1167280-Alexandrium_andersonii.AAC.1